MEGKEFMFSLLLQVFIPILATAWICLYFLNRKKINMRIAKLVIHLVFVLTAISYFIPLFNYGVLGMKDYIYMKSNLTEAKFQEFKKKSKELETLNMKTIFSRQIIDDIYEKKTERDLKKISNFEK